MTAETSKAGRRLTARLRAVMLAAGMVVAVAGSARAECAAVAPSGVLFDAGDRVLFYGDSITVGIIGTPYHYAALVQHMLASTYCSYELLEVEAIGQRGSHYIRYGRRIGRDLSASEIPYDWVMFQDSGRALRLLYANNPDSPRSFPNAVQQTIAEALEAQPDIGVLLATTPPLDHANATSSWEVRYDRVNDFDGHNAALTEIAGDGGHSIVSWAADACRAYAQAPDADWTRDGVHPQPFGEAVLALSILKSIGVPREDLQLDGLMQFHWSLDEGTVGTIADWIYGANPACD